jgi:hypothetical protein
VEMRTTAGGNQGQGAARLDAAEAVASWLGTTRPEGKDSRTTRLTASSPCFDRPPDAILGSATPG